MQPEIVELEYLIDRKEIKRNYTRHLKTGLGRFLTAWITAFAISFVMVFLSMEFRGFFISAAVVSAVVPSCTLWLMYRSYMTAATLAFDEIWNSGGVIRMKFVSGAAGFETSFRDDHAFTSWSSVGRVEELPDAFALMIRGRETLIPKRAFLSNRSIFQFRTMLLENVARERLALME